MTNQHFNDADSLAPLYLGLPVWQHTTWPSQWFGTPDARQQGLEYYSDKLSSVEGNSPFYALPDEATCKRWYDAVPANFKFTFKLNQQISHTDNILLQQDKLEEQLLVMRHLKEKLGLLMLQLPASFSPERLPELAQFMARWPADITLAVELRHPAFFNKGSAEQRVNRLLKTHGVNRVMMDTRALFSGVSLSEAMTEAREKKPRLPLHVWASAKHPVIRFVGHDDDTLNQRCLAPWVKKCHQWREQGISPYLFLHRADNKNAPWLAHLFITMYNTAYPEWKLPDIGVNQQRGLF